MQANTPCLCIFRDTLNKRSEIFCKCYHKRHSSNILLHKDGFGANELQVTLKIKISGDLGGLPSRKDRLLWRVRRSYILLEVFGFRLFFISLQILREILKGDYQLPISITVNLHWKDWSNNSRSWHCAPNTSFLLINSDSWKWCGFSVDQWRSFWVFA